MPEVLEPVRITPDERRSLPDPLIESWRERGFALVDGLVPDDLVAALRRFGHEHFPAPESEDARRHGTFGALAFPAECAAMNELTLHPQLLQAIAELLDVPVPELRLTQSDLWPKYGRSERTLGAYDNQDQRIHVDYPNHTLVHPAPWDRPEAVEAILYLDDVDEVGGPTAVVPREGRDDPLYPWPIVASPGIGDLQYINDRESAEAYMAEQRPESTALREALYAREHHARYRPGTLLLYRHDTWHRGTPLRRGMLRLAQNLTFRRADCEWISTLHTGWAWKMYRHDKLMERLIADASLDQRAVLGFPQPGDRYWCDATIDAVEARYGAYGLDAAPYRRALADGPQ